MYKNKKIFFDLYSRNSDIEFHSECHVSVTKIFDKEWTGLDYPKFGS